VIKNENNFTKLRNEKPKIYYNNFEKMAVLSPVYKLLLPSVWWELEEHIFEM